MGCQQPNPARNAPAATIWRVMPQVRHDRCVTTYRVAEVAELLGVSDDTVRRWVEAGRLPARQEDGRTVVSGAELAALAESLADHPDRAATRAAAVSARNRLAGIVTKVTKDRVMAQVELICGPYRMVSLMSSEAADELGLEPGVRAIASVKSTNVVVERP
jgi:molybdopterin-binding protein